MVLSVELLVVVDGLEAGAAAAGGVTTVDGESVSAGSEVVG